MKNYIKKLKASELAIAIYLTVVLFGLPLVVRNGYFDINVVKYYFYCGTSVLLIPPLLLKLKEGVAVKDFFKSLTLAEKALLVYWVVSALSTLLSPYRFEAFWGNEGRFCGLLLMTIYVIAYFVIARCYKPMSFCMYICIVAGSIVFLLGIADYFNLNLFHFKDNIIDLHLPIFMSTIGNINFYASYGALILGLIATLYTIWPKALGAAIYFILMVISFIGLIIGNSDNAYLTLGVLLAFLPLYLFCNRQGIRRYLMMVSALLLSLMMVKVCDIYLAEVVLAPDGIRAIVARWDSFIYVCLAFWGITAAVYAADYKLHKQEETVSSKIRIGWGIFLLAAAAVLVAVLVDANLLGHAQRYESLRNYVVFNNDWGTHRGFAWRKAVENYMEFPLLQKILGHGPDTFGIISYFHDLEESADLYGELFDSVHNEYLHFFVTIGPIATFAYIMFLAMSVRDMLKCSSSPYIVGIAFAVCCYSAQAVVNINQPLTTPILWTLLGMGAGEYQKHIKTQKTPEAEERSVKRKGRLKVDR